jgi:hypothetical protein
MRAQTLRAVRLPGSRAATPRQAYGGLAADLVTNLDK